MKNELDHTIDLKRYFWILWRRRGMITLCGIAAVCAAVVGLQFASPVYESGATLLILGRQPLARELENIVGGMTPSGDPRGVEEERMAQFAGRVRSQPFLERVVRILSMDQDPVIRARARDQQARTPSMSVDDLATRILVKNLQNRLRFESSGKGLYRVIVADYTPENAQTLAQWISELYLDVSTQNSLNHLRTTREFGAEQLRKYQDQLSRSEAALQAHREATINRDLSLGVVRSDNAVLAEALLERVQDEAAAARVRVNPAHQELFSLGHADEVPLAIDDAEKTRLREQLSTVLEDELIRRLTAGGGEVRSWPPQETYSVVRREVLKSAQQLIAEAYPDAAHELREALVHLLFAEIDSEGHADAASFLANAVSAFKRQAQGGPSRVVELERLEAEVQRNRTLLQTFQAQLVASDVNQAMETTDLGVKMEILDPAQLPLEPVRPDRAKILLAALVLGPLVGVGVAFLSETMDPTLRTLEDFRRVVPEPILGTAPLLTRLQVRHSWWRRHWVSASIAIVLIVSGTIYVNRSALAEHLSTGRLFQLVKPETRVAG